MNQHHRRVILERRDRADDVGRHLLHDRARGRQRLLTPAEHVERLPHHVVVVGDVADGIDPRRMARVEVRLVHVHGVRVVLHRVVPPPESHVDMRRHMHQVAGPGDQAAQDARRRAPRGRRRWTPRSRGCRSGTRPGWSRRPLHDPLEHGDGLDRARRARLARVAPVVPRPQVHEGLGVERRGIVVLGETPGHLADRLRPRGVERGAVGRGIGRVARLERPDVRLILGPGQRRELDRLLEGFPGRLHRRGIHRRVDVGPERVGDAPPAHRAGRVLARPSRNALIASSWLNP